MHKAKVEESWEHTAVVLAMIHNVNCTKRLDQKKPIDFHPFHSRRSNAVQLSPQESVAFLRDLLVPK